ncbi:lecithin retinol acyltransferase family protein [Burkholderia ubonensis]|uniref:lecithin retinol acyltransferase family protein n=1 Tax=Burkholderia ubonensis TaxID=101571 RepID=UPI000F5850C8|nr:lecithin retinol acyltransferase family protein [Burkholderia ubonensis]RQP27045.1 hydrolase [Burkholderia ubonensis]RQP28632.1 hydrolase [Burkholderia ubonensis]RQP29531.1 hydrolase [Burkholderia ubonensis]RQP45994.1 hydrolase [Burkholderia ubonensis]RQP48802.1 hydrolase [Burkholderia ubonensis]
MNHPIHAQSGDAAYGPDLPVGAHLMTRRPGYAYHGIYIGGGKVIHYAGLSRRFRSGPVEVVSVDCFVAGAGLAIIQHDCAPYSGSEVARRAASRLGECNYRLLTNNCEHFCLWCLFGVARSEQVEACLRNPAHAATVVVMLVLCLIAGKWHEATPGSDAGSQELSWQCVA